MLAPDVAAPPRQPQPHVGLLLHLLPAPRVGVSTSPRQRRGRAVGGRVTVGLEQRCQPQLVAVTFFSFNFSLLDSPSLLYSPSRPCHAFVASFVPPSFLPVSSSFFSVASSFRLSAAGRPSGRSAARNPRLSVGSFKRDNQHSESKKQGDLC